MRNSLSFILKSSLELLSACFCQLKYKKLAFQFKVKTIAKSTQAHLIWAISSNTAFLIGIKALNGVKRNKHMTVNNFLRIKKREIL